MSTKRGPHQNVKGQNSQHCVIELNGSGTAFDVQGGTVNLQQGRVSGSGQTFKINAGSLNMTANSQIQMSNFQMKTNDDLTKSATVSLTQCSDNGIEVTNEAWIEKGSVTLNNSKIKAGKDFRFTGGSITAYDNSKIDGVKEVILRQEGSATGGTIKLQNESTLCGEVVNMSAGTVTLTDNSEFTASDVFSFSGGTISAATKSMVGTGNTFNVSGGTINSTVSRVGAIDIVSGEGKNVNITGGTLNVNSGQEVASASDIIGTNSLLGAAINVSGGTINVNSNSYLYSVSNVTFSSGGDVSNYTKGTINLTSKGVINVAGNLYSDITGDNKGTINFTGSNGKIKGDISGVNVNVGTNQATVDGDATFSSGSTLGVTIASKENYGFFTANNITIEDGANLKVTIKNGVLARDESSDFTLLGGTISGKFNKIAENRRYEFTWDEENEGKVHILGIATPGDIVNDAGGSENNAGTADAWGEIDTDDTRLSEKGKEVADLLNTLSQNAVDTASEKAYLDALTAVAPDATPSMQQTTTETANQIFGAVGTRLSGGSVSASSKQGVSGGDFSLKNTAVWLQGLANKAKLDTSKSANNFDSNTYGMALGIESYIIDDVVKAGLGYAYSGTSIDGYLRDTDVKTNSAIIYGEYKPNNWFVNGVISYGWSDYEETKKVAGTNVSADWKVQSVAVQVMTGYNFELKNNYGVIPEIGLRYVNINQDSYKDSADQTISSHTGDIFTGVIGGKVNKVFKRKNGLVIVPEVKLAATYDLKNDDSTSTVTLANGTSYSVKGESMDKFGIETGVGVSADITEKFVVSLGYEGKFIKDYQDHTGLINLKYKF